jgi:D-arabinose 1-dehydrogenase-like Zn-dependent alcohol dehydrogenase
LKAVYLNKHGGPDVLEFGEIEVPELKQSEVLVKLHAAALNRADIFVRQGWPGLKISYPHVLGADGAGEIHAIAEGIQDVRVGDRVVINPNIGCGECSICLSGKDNLCRDWHLLGESLPGTYAQYVAVPERNLINLPDGIGYAAAASGDWRFRRG